MRGWIHLLKGIPDLILRYMEDVVLDESKGYWKNVGTYKKGGGIVIQREYVWARTNGKCSTGQDV